MGSLKPWQLVLVIIAVLVLAVSLWMTVFSGSRVDFGDRVYMVDVATGDAGSAPREDLYLRHQGLLRRGGAGRSAAGPRG